MSQVSTNQPRRGTASESRYSLFEFEAQFPDDAACLAYLMAEKYPEGVFCEKCEKVTSHYREKARPSWSCQFCGHRVHPMVGTIFEDSATSLRLWFYAIYLMASTRCGISAKQLERELGVTYKTAWRMFKQIGSLLVQDDAPIGGEGEIVEADEAFIGGLSKWRNHGKPKGKGGGWVGKQPVHRFVQRGRDGKIGKIRARVLLQSDTATFTSQVTESVHVRVLPKSSLFTDTYVGYDRMGERGFKHKRVNHTRRIYVDGIVHTNTIEGFWSLLRRGISGVYHRVSTKHLQTYVDEYVFRYNNRDATGRGDVRGFPFARRSEAPEGVAAALLRPSKNSRHFGIGISNPDFVRCDGSPLRVSGSCLGGIRSPSYDSRSSGSGLIGFRPVSLIFSWAPARISLSFVGDTMK